MRRFAALLALLALPAAAQEGRSPASDVRSRLRAWLKDHSLADKAEVLKGGTASMRTIYEERIDLAGPAFDDVTDLLYTIRFRADTGVDARLCRDRFAHTRMPIQGGEEHELGDLVVSIVDWAYNLEPAGGATFQLEESAPTHHPVYFDPQACPDLHTTVVVYPANYVAGKGYQELDRALAQFGLDWTFRYGVILVSSPSRLWPGAAPRGPLTAAEQGALKSAIADFDAVDVEVRTRASRAILPLGTGALAALRAVTGSEEATGRAAELIRKISALYGDFAWGTDCGMDSQSLNAEEKALAERVNSADLRLPATKATFTDERLDAVISAIGRTLELEIEVADVIADYKITLDASGLRLRDALLLVSRTQGLDVTIQNGRLLIDVKRTK